MNVSKYCWKKPGVHLWAMKDSPLDSEKAAALLGSEALRSPGVPLGSDGNICMQEDWERRGADRLGKDRGFAPPSVEETCLGTWDGPRLCGFWGRLGPQNLGLGVQWQGW